MPHTNSLKIYLPHQEAKSYVQSSYKIEGSSLRSEDKTLTEEKLIKQCLKGNRRAQMMLYERHAAVMKMVCFRYLYDKSKAEESLNRAFLKVFTKLKLYKNKGSFEGWIRKIVVNECLDINRQYKPIISIDEEASHHGLSSHLQTEIKHDLEYILKVVDQLPEGYKLVFNMIEIDGFSHKEVSQELNITESASRSQLAKAKKILRKKLELFKA